MNCSPILENLKKILQSPDLKSKEWIYQQYDSQVMGDTIEIAGDAAIVRVHGTNKALAMTSDCTTRYVKADPFLGGQQAVCETFRNISATGAKPMAITNCLNFGNPEKPEIMGQIVKAIKGINEACKFLQYPVVSGNVSLYNETDGKAINPSPTIGGVGLFKDLTKRVNLFFKNTDDEIFILGKSKGHLDCSIFQRDVLGIREEKNPPQNNLEIEKNHAEFIRTLIFDGKINACHDVSDGGILVTIFEMCNELGFEFALEFLEKNQKNLNDILFGEDQGRYIFSCKKNAVEEIKDFALEKNFELFKLGKIINNKKIKIADAEILLSQLKEINQLQF
jgi:phosphoribosylformylglycinamidine (FGAM) synthase-like enzyme